MEDDKDKGKTNEDPAGDKGAPGGGAQDPPVTPPATKPTPPPAGKKSVEDLEKELEETKREAQGLRQERKDLAKERDALSKRFEDMEKEKLAEQGRYKELYEKKEKELADEKAATEKRMVRSELKAAAVAAGIIDLDLLSTIPQDGVKVDEDGEVVGVSEAVAKYKESKPYLFKDAGTSGGDKSGEDKTKPTGGAKKPPSHSAKPNTEDVRKLPKAERKAKLNGVLDAIRRGA